MRPVLISLKFGFRTISSKTKLVIPFYLINLTLAALIAVPVWTMIEQFAGSSSPAENSIGGPNWNLIFEFIVHNSGRLASLKWMVIAVPFVFILGISFLSAGTISTISFSARFEYAVFISQATRYFGRFLKLTLLSVPLMPLLFSSVFLADLVQRLAFGSDPFENVTYWFGWARLGLGFLALALYGMILDYARIDVIIKGEKRVHKSLLRSLGFVFTHLSKTLGLCFILALCSATLFAFYLLGSHVMATLHWWILAALFVYQQAYIVARNAIKVVTYASEIRLYRELV